MLIGELSSQTGFSRDTIRFYEKKGLISISKKDRRDNNYKDYPESIRDRLLTIKRLKTLGFTLNETAELLDLIQANEATCNTISDKITSKIEDIDQKIQGLIQLKNYLYKQSTIQNPSCNANSNENCSVFTNELHKNKS